MQQQRHDLEAADIRVVIVTFERGMVARAYIEDTHVPFPVLVDESRGLYGAYGMLRGGLLAIWGPRTWWAYVQELWQGRRPLTGRAPADVHQLGGDVLIDPDGRLRLIHVGSGPGDRPSIAALLAARHRAPAGRLRS